MDNQVDFTVLTERMAAQTEAYEKFSQALVKILGLLDEVRDTLKDQSHADAEVFRDLLKAVITISTEIKAYIDITKTGDANLAAQLSDQNRIMLAMANDLQAQKVLLERAADEIHARIEDGHSALANPLKVIGEVNVKVDAALRALEASHAVVVHNSKILSTMDTRVGDMDRSRADWRLFWKSSKLYIYAIVTFIALVESLIQLGLIKIVWGGK